MMSDNLLCKDLDHILAYTEDLWKEARGERFFITGGTGFVGTWLTESLLWANRRLALHLSVFVLTRHPDTFYARLPYLAADPALTLISGDVRRFQYPPGLFPFIIHAASASYNLADPESLVSSFEQDTAATRNVLKFAQAARASRFLFTSSGAVYGKQPPELSHIPEDYPGAPSAADPNSAYGQAKRISEFFCASCAQAGALDVMIARLFAFTGPYLPLDGQYASGNFVRDALAGHSVHIQGDGTSYRSYMYAADLALWLWTILFRGRSTCPYNVGSPEEITIWELAQRVVEATAPGTPIRVSQEAVDGRPASRYIPDTRRAENELGLRCQISLEDGIRRMYEWHTTCRGVERVCT
jgi:dTDP-glucose 4,6-dehydratase